jgi:hypothetical protein
MAEWTDTTTGVVDANGYPGPNNVPSWANLGAGGADTHSYMPIEDAAGARIGTHLRFFSGHNTIADRYIFDFFGAGWPNFFKTVPVHVVRQSGNCAPGGTAVIRYKYDDPVRLPAIAAPPNVALHLTYQIQMRQGAGGLLHVGWLFVHSGSFDVTLALDQAFVDAASDPDHYRRGQLEYSTGTAAPAALNNHFGTTLTKRP